MSSEMKLGLALSGGGFRAALYHIGVMAQLARRQILPHVNTISAVSGGSILAAYYVLRLERELVEHGGALDPMDYVSLMHELELEFLQAVQKNMRMRTFANPLKNLKMIRPSYSRSDRMGELLDRYFFEPALTGAPGSRTSKIEIRCLGGIEDKRGSRFPRLVLNATSLNTGHAWRFDGTTMGESTPANEDEWDFNRSALFAAAPTYEQMTLKRGRISIGKAVAASAAVPGMFQPLQVTHLYEDPVQLVDGGVFDNQGIDALIDGGCTHVIVSDAGGQMLDVKRAPSWFLGAALRSSAVQYGRVRELGLERARSRYGPKRLALIHTRRGVRPSSRPWRNKEGTLEGIPSAQQRPDEHSPVHAAVQELLANIRTDLDVFNDVEGRSLMLSGYLLADWEFDRKTGEVFGAPTLGVEPLPVGPFVFEAYGALLKNAPDGRFERLLSAAKSRFLKMLKVRPVVAVVLAPVVYGPLIGAIAGLTIVSIAYLPDLIVKIPFVGEPINHAVVSFAREIGKRSALYVVSAFAGGLALSYLLARRAVAHRLPSTFTGGGFARRVSQVARGAVLVSRVLAALLGLLVVWPSMWIYDSLYRKAGIRSRVLPGG